MNEIEELDVTFNVNNIPINPHSLFNNQALCQYKITTQSSSNITSLLTLDAVWNVNEPVDNKNFDLLLNSLNAINHNSNNSKTWTSSLRDQIDPVALFKKSLPESAECCLVKYKGLDGFVLDKCSCTLEIHESNKHRPIENIDRQQTSTKYLNPESYDNQSKLAEEQRFKPKFNRPKLTRTTTLQPVINSTPPNTETDPESDEELKQHKHNVAKITFKTAKEQLLASNPGAKRTLGASRKAQGKFVSPMLGVQDKQEQQVTETELTDERLKHIDPKMIELIESEIIDKGTPIGWDDIAGLQMAKSVIQEAVVWPLLRPDIFTGLRRPPKGILLFGPPGTGKTLIGKCVAAQCNATFFSISASSLTSKWLGDGEKMVRALFAVARCHQPAVIFIDEIDSLLTQRSDTEHEATRRIKTEFLVQFDGAATEEEDRLLIVGATNRPQELDEAARRRLVKRLYIPLPDADARKQIITNLLRNEKHEVSDSEAEEVGRLCAGYSGADVRALCAEAAMGPVRCVPLHRMAAIATDQVRPVNMQDFRNALQRVRPSVSQNDLGQYVKWNETYGQGF